MNFPISTPIIASRPRDQADPDQACEAQAHTGAPGARSPEEKQRILAHLRQQLAEIEATACDNAPPGQRTWDELELDRDKAQLAIFHAKLAQPPGDGCMERVSRALLEANARLLALGIAQAECALASPFKARS